METPLARRATLADQHTARRRQRRRTRSRAHGNSVNVVYLARRPHIPLHPDRQPRHTAPIVRTIGVTIADGGREPEESAPARCAATPPSTQTSAAATNRRAHDVQDVDAEQRHRMAAGTDDEGLKAEQKREDEDLEAAAARPLRPPRRLPPRRTARRGGQHARRRPRATETAAPQTRREIASRNDGAVDARTRRVHASSVWASIIRRTAMPRAQSM